MSCNVNYKGSQIASVGANQTKTLLTAGKYCEDDFTLVDTSNPVAEENDVIFIDYDGTIRYSYSADDFLALTALPPNPVHDGLVAQGWNWTLADAKEYVQTYGEHCIGQCYDTVDGKLRLHIRVQERDLTRTIGIRAKKSSGGSGSIDWGDGTSTDISSTSYTIYYHEYVVGNYTIAIGKTAGTITIGGYQNSVINGGAQFVRKINTGSLIYVDINTNGWADFLINPAANLETISCEATYFALMYFGYRGCVKLKAVVAKNILNNNTPVLGSWCFYYCEHIKYVSIPKCSNAVLSSYMFSESGINSFIIDGVTSTESYAFNMARELSKLRIGKTVQSIGTGVLRFEGIRESYFKELRIDALTPPTLASSSSFYKLPNSSIIIIPFASLAAYLTGTNYPAPATYTYIGFATYASGATLPTQDSTQAYNVVWYASKADAIAQTNAISTGNGKEIYCRYTAA